jgi:hypothetical protein
VVTPHFLDMADPLSIPLPDDGVPASQPSRDIKLPAFWTTRPRAWFTYIESRFHLKNIADEQIQFDHVLSALPEDMVGQILDLVEAAPEAAPYTFLKARILETHQLSDYEKFDMLVKREPLGDRKPSQLLAAMMEYCPAGMEKTLPFHYYFTQRLPIALHTQLGEVEHGDPRALAARADRLWTMHSPSGSAVACVEPAAPAVAAIRGSSRGHGGRGRGGSQRGRGAQRARSPAGAAAVRCSQSWYCRHWRHGGRRAHPLCLSPPFLWSLLLPLEFCGQGPEVSGPLQLGKLAAQGRLNAVAPGPLVHVVDQISKRRFLVDTGTSFSIFPHRSSAVPSGPSLFGPAGKIIPCWGETTLSLLFGGRRFEWTFLLAAVTFPIIGVDFLRYFRLLVDPAANRLVDPHTSEAITAVSGSPTPTTWCISPSSSPQPPASPPQSPASPPQSPASPPQSPGPVCVLPPPPPQPIMAAVSKFEAVLATFPAVLNASKILPTPAGDVKHYIKTTGPPIASRFRRLDGEKLAAARAEFLQMEKDGIVRWSDSPWSSPLHMVRKPDSSWRPCGDYRRLNLVTMPDSYPLPNMLDFTEKLAGCVIFSKVDLRKGYHQIPMNEDDIQKTAIITPFGLFEFLRMTFGLRNAGNTFQRRIDRILSGLDFVFAYLDDVIVASRSEAEHLHHLHLLFQRLQDAGLVINREKCVFGVAAVEFLGHHVSAAGTAPIASNVAAIQRHPQPTTVKELQGFLGVVNFYRRFVPSLMVDASNEHVGAALQQRTSPSAPWQPLGFFSKKLEPAQTRYSAFDRELWACFAGIRHFRHMLKGRRFAILTDHKPLTHALHR